MEYIRGNEKKSFDQAIKEENQRIKLSDENLRNFSYLSRGYYFKQIQNCYSLFKKNQILFLNFDDLTNNFNEVMYSIQSFLGCKKENYPQRPERVTWLEKKKNVSFKLDTKKIFVEKLIDDYQNFKKITGFKFYNFENL